MTPSDLNPRQKLIAKGLTFSGAAPFIVAAVVHQAMFWMGPDSVNGIGPWIESAVAVYGVAIVSFLCGVHWAISLFFANACPANLLIRSNLITLAAWAAVLIPDHKICLAVHIVCFVYLLWLDRGLHKAGVLPDWFFRLRVQITTIVTLALVATALP